MLDPSLEKDVAEVLIDEATLQRQGGRAGRTHHGGLPRPPGDARERPQGRAALHGRPHARRSALPVRIDLMEVSSYGGATETSGQVRILKDLSSSIEGRDVLIVEDIIDTGLTLNYLTEYLRGKDPRSLRICALLDKPARRLVEIDIAYRGLRDPRPLRHRLRPRLRRGLSQPALHRRPAPGGLRRRVRRGLGRGRTLIALGSVLAICSIPLAWLRAGGTVLEVSGLDRAGRRAAGPGHLRGGGAPCWPHRRALRDPIGVLLARPRHRPTCCSWRSAWWAWSPRSSSCSGPRAASAWRRSTRPGLWLAVAGMALATWGVLELLAERRDDSL